jgi:ribonuclease BN (tRNA processing enzyme)
VGAKRVVPFHFSARYQHEPRSLLEEVERGLGRPLAPKKADSSLTDSAR